jgi:hypothetical protein
MEWLRDRLARLRHEQGNYLLKNVMPLICVAQLCLAEVTHGLTAPVEKQRGDSDAAVLFDQSGRSALVTVGSAPPLRLSP